MSAALFEVVVVVVVLEVVANVVGIVVLVHSTIYTSTMYYI